MADVDPARPNLAWTSNAQARIEQTITMLERMSADVARYYPETGTSDVIDGARNAMQRALDKLRFTARADMYECDARPDKRRDAPGRA